MDVRSSSRVTDQLVQSNSGTSLEVALRVVSDPSNVETGCNVETHCDDEESKVPSANLRYSGKQDVT